MLKTIIKTAFLIIWIIPANCWGQIIVKDEFTPTELVSKMFLNDSSGMKITSVNYTGSPTAIGAFYSGTEYLPVAKGIVLSTGNAKGVDGPNDSEMHGSMQFTPGDPELEKIAGRNTADAAILEFTFYPVTDKVSFVYFFGSDEYPEFVNKGVNDVFALLISGPGFPQPFNMARIPDSNDPVTIDHVNASRNSSWYRNNIIFSYATAEQLEMAEIAYSFQYDGYTLALEASATVTPYQPYKIKIAIADAGDNVYDSGVFLKAKSLQSKGVRVPLQQLVIGDSVINELETGWAEIQSMPDEIKIISRIQFEFNSHVLLEEYYDELDKLIALFDRYFDLTIELTGHTDDLGSVEYNQTLSYERARSIARYIINEGISPHRINFTGKGKSEPVAPGDSESARAKNRRVEMILR